MVNPQARYFPGKEYKCKICGRKHKLQLYLPHDMQLILKRVAKASKWGNLTDFVIFSLMDILGLESWEVDVARPVVPPPRIRFFLSELMDMDDLEEFAKEYGIKVAGKTKKQIIQQIADHPRVSVVADMKIKRCSICKKIDHNALTCQNKNTKFAGMS